MREVRKVANLKRRKAVNLRKSWRTKGWRTVKDVTPPLTSVPGRWSGAWLG